MSHLPADVNARRLDSDSRGKVAPLLTARAPVQMLTGDWLMRKMDTHLCVSADGCLKRDLPFSLQSEMLTDCVMLFCLRHSV